ncbi:MAG TPA: exosortase/archaeosortase family protein [Verrucomicrobiae bacterium]|nr:exosortase/archaeosortase family protein [Verrucomicrobiae bacterium]
MNSAQKFAAGLFILLFAGWFAQKIEWKATNTAQVLYFILLAAFFLLLIFLDPKVWKQLSNKGFFFALLAVWLALFQFLGNSILGYVHTSSLFSWMYDGYNSPNPVNDSSFCDLIPFLVLGLFWWKRNELVAQPKTKSWPGFVLLILAIGLHLFGYVLQQPRCSVVALFTGIYGLMGLVWGFEWLKKSFFPFFLFIFSGPLDIVIQPITFWLRYFVSALTEWVAHYIFGIGVMRQGTQLFDPSGSYGYDVAAACSGIRSLVAIFLLATIYAFIAFRAPWKRIFLMALAVPFAVLGNLLRMLLIIIAAALGGQDWGNYVHEGCPIHVPRVGDIAIVNLLPYVPAIIGLLWIGRWLEKMPDAQAKEPS